MKEILLLKPPHNALSLWCIRGVFWRFVGGGFAPLSPHTRGRGVTVTGGGGLRESELISRHWLHGHPIVDLSATSGHAQWVCWHIKVLDMRDVRTCVECNVCTWWAACSWRGSFTWDIKLNILPTCNWWIYSFVTDIRGLCSCHGADQWSNRGVDNSSLTGDDRCHWPISYRCPVWIILSLVHINGVWQQRPIITNNNH